MRPVLAAILLSLGLLHAEEAPDIRLVAYNLESYLDVTQVDRVKQSVLIDVITATAPDILGVCEVGDESVVISLRKELKTAGVDLPHLEWVDCPGDRHLALLSRYPIASRQSQTQLTYQIDDLRLPVSRGFLDVTLHITPTYRLRCLGAHLKSRREVAVADEALMRRNEAHLLRRHVEDILDQEPYANLIVYGDFNDTRNTPSIRAIQGLAGSAQYLRALPLEDAKGLTWTHYWDTADVYSRIDFLFTSRGLDREIRYADSFIFDHRDWELASDHRPLVATLQAKDQ